MLTHGIIGQVDARPETQVPARPVQLVPDSAVRKPNKFIFAFGDAAAVVTAAGGETFVGCFAEFGALRRGGGDEAENCECCREEWNVSRHCV